MWFLSWVLVYPHQQQICLVLLSGPYHQQKIQEKDAANDDSDGRIFEKLFQVHLTPVNLVRGNKETARKRRHMGAQTLCVCWIGQRSNLIGNNKKLEQTNYNDYPAIPNIQLSRKSWNFQHVMLSVVAGVISQLKCQGIPHEARHYFESLREYSSLNLQNNSSKLKEIEAK